jgi:hypothetical protein
MRRCRLRRRRLFLRPLRPKAPPRQIARPLRPKAPPRRIAQRPTQRTMQRARRLQPSLIILQLLRPALRGPAVRFPATGRRQGRRIRRWLSQRRPNRPLPISQRQRLNPVLSLQQLQQMGRRRNEAKSFGGLPPDFLPKLSVSAGFMRLSLMKAAHEDFGSAPRQEIRVVPRFQPTHARANVGRPSW